MDVLLQALNGTWERCGVDRLAGIVPEAVKATANAWGSDHASFRLRRRADGLFPDISAFTPVQLHEGGKRVWTGRVVETPVSDADGSVVSVECQGAQYRLDDDVLERVYVHSRLTDWQDMRTPVSAILGLGTSGAPAGYQVGNGEGVITLTMPSGGALTPNTLVGVQLDLGPYNLAKRVVMTWDASTAYPGATIYCRGTDTPDATWGTYDDAFSAAHTAGPTTSRGTFATPHRYVQVFLWWGGAAGTAFGDLWARLQSVQVFTDTAYESGDASALTADTVIKDAVSRGTTGLSADLSQVAAPSPTFTIPHLAPGEPLTPRELIAAVAALHTMNAKVDALDRITFAAPPTVARLKVGAWSGCTFEDASANAADGIYNRAMVTGTGPDGLPVRVERRASQLPGIAQIPASVALTNPGAEVNTAGWSATGPGPPTLVRTTTAGEFDTGVAALKLGWLGYTTLTGTTTGTFRKGTTYVLTVRLKATIGVPFYLRLGDAISKAEVVVIAPTAAFGTYTVAWTPSADSTSAVVEVVPAGGVGTAYVDSLNISTAAPTLADRRNIVRTKVVQASAAITAVIGQQLADVFLAGHTTTPQKGSVTITGRGARNVLTDATVAPAMLLLETGNLLRLAHRVHPDTGALGRDAVISTVSYDDDARTANVALDADRDQLDTLLARYALVAGGVA